MNENCKLILGDCLEKMKEIPDNSVDLVLTDPPYGITSCEWDTKIPLKLLWKEFNRVIKEKSAIIMTASQPFSSIVIMSNLKSYKYCWVWIKTKASGHLDAKNKPMKKHEEVLVFCNNGFPNYYPQGLVDGTFKTGRNKHITNKVYKQYENHIVSHKANYPKTTLFFSNPSGKGHLHPTQKPVELMEYLVKTYSKERQTILDPFMGSGTTGVASLKLQRKFIGIEINEEYFEIAKKRIGEWENQSRLALAKKEAVKKQK